MSDKDTKLKKLLLKISKEWREVIKPDEICVQHLLEIPQ